jgi:hypothetical protein
MLPIGKVSAGTGFYVSGSAQVTEARSESNDNTATWQGSSLSAANMSINADVASIIGSEVTAGTLDLNADSILLGAGTNTQSSSFEQDSRNVGVGVSSSGAGSWNANVGYNEASSSSEATQHVNTRLNVGHLNSTSDTLTLKGAVITANTADITTGTLTVESLQDTHKSENSSMGVNVGVGAGSDSIGKPQSGSGGANFAKGDSEGAITGEQTAILIGNGADSQITANHTNLIGGMIANASWEMPEGADENTAPVLVDHGQLNFATGTLTVSDLRDYSRSSQTGAGLQISASTTTISATDEGHRMEGKTQATIGKGNVLVGGIALDEHEDFASLNRHLDKGQIVTLDQQTGAMNASVTFDNRIFTGAGWQNIKEQHQDAGRNWQIVAAALEKDVQRISTDIVPDTVGEWLKEADKYSLGLLPFDGSDNGGLLSQAPVLLGSRDVFGGSRQIRPGDDHHVLANPDLYMSADQLPGYSDLSPEGQAALQGLMVSREFIAISTDNATYSNHTNGMMNTPAEAMVNAIEQSASNLLTQNYNPRHGFLADILEIGADKLGYRLTQGLDWLGADLNIMTGAAAQTGEFMYDVMASRQNATFANHSQANILTLSGLNMLNAVDYEVFWNKEDRISSFQFVSYGSPVANQTMFDALDALKLSYVGSAANAGDFVAEGLGGNTGIWLYGRDGANFSNHTLSGPSWLYKLPDASLLLTGEKYPNANSTNTLSPHSGYQCIVNCGGVTP